MVEIQDFEPLQYEQNQKIRPKLPWHRHLEKTDNTKSISPQHSHEQMQETKCTIQIDPRRSYRLMNVGRKGQRGIRSGFITHSAAMVYSDAALPGLWGMFS
jgi:hypothetical protein